MVFLSIKKRSILLTCLGILTVHAAFSQSYSGLSSYSVVANGHYVYGFKNEKDKVVIKARYDDISTFKTRAICGAKLNGKWGFIDRKGNEVVPFEYDEVNELYVKKDGRWGLINDAGKYIIPIKYTSLFPTWKWLAASIDGVKYGFIDSADKQLTPFIYDGIKPYAAEGNIIKNSDGSFTWKTPNPLAAIKLNGSWGYEDTTFTFIIPPIYKDALNFSVSGFAWLSADGEYYGAITRYNKLILPFYFRNVSDFDRNGIASAHLGTIPGTIRYNGLFTEERTKQTRQVQTARIEKRDEMIENGYKASDNKKRKEAIDWFTKSYNNGNADAARILADYYAMDTANAESRKAAVNWYKIGAKHNILYCLFELSSMNYAGKDMPKNEVEGFNLLRTMAAYAEGYKLEEDLFEDDIDLVVYGLYSLGEAYREGKVTPKDMKLAAYWYKKAADHDSPDAHDALGDCYYSGEGVPKNFTEAMRHYTLAGDEYTNTLYKLGLMYLNGEGASKNEAEAIKLFKQAAARNDKDAIAILKKMNVK